MPTFFQRLVTAARALFGLPHDGRNSTGSVSVRVDDSPGWIPFLQKGGPTDRPWSEVLLDITDAFTAWRKNFLIRRIVAVIRSYVVGGGITVTSKRPEVEQFIADFWHHRQNRIDQRLGPISDELCRSGELFVTFHTNKIDGMSYIRCIPTSTIVQIDTAKNDYESELRYGEMRDTIEPHWWLGPNHPAATVRDDAGRLPPIMVHFAVNKAIGSTRGESDLTPILPWAKRYTEWLKDRVKINRIRTRQAMLDIEIADDAQVDKKRQQLQTSNPIEHGIYIHGPGEKLIVHSLRLDAKDVKDDGRALRLAIAAGSGLALHYLAEGESTNYATAREMGEPTARFLTDRQAELCQFLQDIVTIAYYRQQLTLGKPAKLDDDLELAAVTGEVAREDNANLATAGKDVVEALAQMRVNGWIDDRTAVNLAFKFLGEILTDDEITEILGRAEPAAAGDGVPKDDDAADDQATTPLIPDSSDEG